jgi:ArsR family transcriptional regulator
MLRCASRGCQHGLVPRNRPDAFHAIHLMSRSILARSPVALARVFRALGDPTRLSMLTELAVRERAVTALVQRLGVPQPAVSRHLRVLREAGLVEDERRARFIIYRLAPGVREQLPALVARLLSPAAVETFEAEVSPPPGTGPDDVPDRSSVLFVD